MKEITQKREYTVVLSFTQTSREGQLTYSGKVAWEERWGGMAGTGYEGQEDTSWVVGMFTILTVVMDSEV